MKGKFYRLFAIMAMVLLFTASAFAQTKDAKDKDSESKLRSQLPQLLGSNNAGTVFYMTFHPCWETAAKQNFVRVYISSAVETTVTLEIPALGIVKQQKTIPNDIVEFVLYPTEAQMYSKPGASAIKPLPAQVWQGRAVKVSADYPIICYGVTRFQYTSDGYLALPVSSLSKKYTVSSYADPTDNTGQYLPSYTSIIGIYDATKVDFIVGGNTSMAIPLEDGVSEAKAGEKVSRVLNDGDVWLIPGKYAYNDLSGSSVRASKPVNVISGNFCAYIPTEVAACDFISEQELPQNTWGYKYHVTQIAGRLKNSVIKIFPKEIDTDLYKDNELFGTLTALDGFRGSGWIERRADLGDPRPVVISSTKPIYVVQYNPGQQDDNVVSDPFQMVLTPLEQYQKEIVWCTPGIKGGYGFKDNFINIVFKGTPEGGIPQDLEFANVEGGNFNWKPLVDIDGFPGTKFIDTADDGRIYYSKTYKLPEDGVYKIRANDPLANYAYGFDDYDSYGYPTSVATADLEVPDSLPPIFYYHQECWGDVINYFDPAYNKDPYWGGVVHDEPEIDPENMSKLALFYMDPEDSYNYKIEIQPFQVGIDYKTLFNLHVVDRTSNARAHLVATDRRGNRADTIIQFFPIVLQIDPYKWDAGLFKPTDAPVKKAFTVTNKTPGKAVVPEDLILKTMKEGLPSQGFTISVNNPADLTKEIPTGGSITFYVTFTPSQIGTFRDSVGVGDLCNFRMQTIVKASVGQPAIRADDYDFQARIVGQRTQQQPLAVANNQADGSNTDLIIKQVVYDNTMVGDMGSGKTFEIQLPDGRKLDDVTDANPLVVPMNQSITFNTTFKAGAVQDYATQITWVADIDQPDNLTILQGRGIKPALAATGDDWMKRRADINAYKKDPVGVYPFNQYPSPNAAIKLTNSGSDAVTLTAPEIQDDQNGSDYEVSVGGVWRPLNEQGTLNDIFNGMKIGAGNDVTIPVFFHPRSVSGTHSLTIAFNSDASEKPVSVLQGIAIWPRVDALGHDFETQIIGLAAEKGSVKFWNSDWEFSDSLTIKGFTENAGSNSTISSDKATNPIFYYDLTNITDQNGNVLTLPITLKIGDTINVPCEFNPVAAGQGYTASLTTISDAEQEVTAPLTGSADEEGTVMTDASVVTCRNLTKILTPTITNTGTVPVTVIGFKIKATPGSGVVESDFTPLEQHFTLGDRNSDTKSHTVRIQFTPTVLYNNVQVQLVLVFENFNNNLKTISGDSCTLTVTATHELFYTHGNVMTPSDPTYKKTADVVIGAQGGVTYGIFLDYSKDQPDFQSLQYNVSISYRKDFIGVASDGNGVAVKVGKEFAALGYTISNLKRTMGDGNIETIDVTLTGSQPITKAATNMEVLTVSFDAYMPWYTDAQGNVTQYKDQTPAIISHTIDAGDVCVSYSSDSASVKLDPVCFNGGRQVILTGTNFGMKPISPNPVSSLGANIDFSVGWDNAYTEIKIYNENMQEISTPISEVMQEGSYQVQLPIEKMPSGAYFIRMKSAYYTSPLVKCIVQK